MYLFLFKFKFLLYFFLCLFLSKETQHDITSKKSVKHNTKLKDFKSKTKDSCSKTVLIIFCFRSALMDIKFCPSMEAVNSIVTYKGIQKDTKLLADRLEIHDLALSQIPTYSHCKPAYFNC